VFVHKADPTFKNVIEIVARHDAITGLGTTA